MKIDWQKMNGLVPAIVQDAETLQVLMLGYVNQEALAKTIETGEVTFFSRSKQRLWTKGETSENKLKFVSAKVDCDSDALLIRARPLGPTCHTGMTSCFEEERAPGLGFLAYLQSVLRERHAESQKNMESSSYTVKLFREGLDRVAQKVGEEAVETVIAAKNDDPKIFVNEASDLLFHLMALLEKRGNSLQDLVDCLAARHRPTR